MIYEYHFSEYFVCECDIYSPIGAKVGRGQRSGALLRLQTCIFYT
jgi:hypothetical protein